MWQTRPVEDYLMLLHRSNMLAEVPLSQLVIDVTPTLRKVCQPECIVSLQNESPLVSNKDLFSILESSRTFPQDYDLS